MVGTRSTAKAAISGGPSAQRSGRGGRLESRLVDDRCAVDQLIGEAAKIMKHWNDTFSFRFFISLD
jgi:hypothetical protein